MKGPWPIAYIRDPRRCNARVMQSMIKIRSSRIIGQDEKHLGMRYYLVTSIEAAVAGSNMRRWGGYYTRFRSRYVANWSLIQLPKSRAEY